MIASALKVRKALDLLCQQHSNDKALPRLYDDEWDVIEALHKNSGVSTPLSLRVSLRLLLSKMFVEATHMFSQSNTPLLFEVIPIIDALQAHFDEIKDDTDLPDVVRHGAARASIVLSKYYSLTDDSEVYRIAMCMSSFTFPFFHR